MMKVAVPFKSKLYHAKRNPSLLKDLALDLAFSKIYKMKLKNYFIHKPQIFADYDYTRLKLNKLCCMEDWENEEMKTMLGRMGYSGYVHRKDWEWSLGLIAMQRFNLLNSNSTVLGVGSGRERILFYLANDLVKHVYATDLYSMNGWDEAPADFMKNPEKFTKQEYNHERLTVMNMDGRKLGFNSNLFDIVFSFSSIEHFGGERHSGALEAVREMGRVLKPNGIAVVATEFILNDKDHAEFYNERTIFSHLVNKLDNLQLVEPLDLTITRKTMNTMLKFYPEALKWHNMSNEYKRNHPHILIRIGNMVHTSIMLVLRKV